MAQIGRGLRALLLALWLAGPSLAAGIMGQGDEPANGQPLETGQVQLADVEAPVWEFGRASGDWVGSKHFSIVQDTPGFKNWSEPQKPGGYCFGMSVLTAAWFMQVIQPVQIGTWGSLGLDRSVDAGALDAGSLSRGAWDFTPNQQQALQGARLRARSNADPELVREMVRKCWHNQFNMGITGNSAAVYNLWMKALADSDEGIAVGAWYTGNGGGHAWVVVGAQEGFGARNGEQTDVRVTRFQIVDNNVIYTATGDERRAERPGAARQDYVLYFHDTRTWSLSPAHRARYADVQPGEFLLPAQLRSMNNADVASVALGSLQNPRAGQGGEAPALDPLLDAPKGSAVGAPAAAPGE